ncbi:hypothetical protein GQ53DRAFT_837333 [Thozetella sp. PMI_491]|nr:hypothetical protein GQ53DRAFT_837333 [Thozetella sp. PMI_491]
MDPVTTYSLFCNIITTVDAAVSAAKNLKELYDSSSGFSREAQRIGIETEHLTSVANDLTSSQAQLSSITKNVVLNKVAEECVEISKRIQLVLEKCKVKPLGPRAVAVLKAWVKSQTVKRELQELQLELQSSSDRLQTAMAAVTLADLADMKQSLWNAGKHQKEVMNKLSSIHREFSANHGIFQDMGRLTALFEEARGSIRDATIIRALKLPSAHSREREIHNSHEKTFKWVVEPEYDLQTQPGSRRVSFLDWLQKGSGVFHVAGKPGSGKSTLLKFLTRDHRVRESLERWAASSQKQLVVSKFFFWRYGSYDQRSVPGLIRGLLSEMCVDNPSIIRLLFPHLWGEVKLGSEVTISDDDISAAFDEITTNPDIRGRFSLCFFIDGLDEFNDVGTTHWKLAKMLQGWTHQSEGDTSAHNFLKLCVSSREDHSIMTVFDASHQIRLQDITKGDISAMVEDILIRNEYFQRLQNEDDSGCRELIASIIQGADGVFLWVSLLLGLLEEELPGASSVATLRNIVRTTPPRLEDFIGDILNTIPKHHRRGAYFVLAMALRIMGFHLSNHNKFSLGEQIEYDQIFGDMYWRPHLLAYGLSAVLETLEVGDALDYYEPALAGSVTGKHELQRQSVIVKIRMWCRGLLDVLTVDQWDVAGDLDLESGDDHSEWSLSNPDEAVLESGTDHKKNFMLLKFTHRAIPEYLMSIIQDKAREHDFDDEDIAKGIIAMLIKETTSSYNDTKALARNSGFCLQHALRLLRLRELSEASSIFPMLDRLEHARLQAYRRMNPNATGAFDALPGSHQEFFVNNKLVASERDTHGAYLPWDESATVLAHASHAGLHEYIQWKIKNSPEIRDHPSLLYSALAALSIYYCFFWSRYPRCYTSTLQLLLSAGVPLDVPVPIEPAGTRGVYYGTDSLYRIQLRHILEFFAGDTGLARDSNREGPDVRAGWTWLIVLPTIINALSMSDIEYQHLSQMWEFLEVWLKFGATPPIDIVFEERKGTWGSELKQLVVRYTVSQYSKYRSTVQGIRAGFTNAGFILKPVLDFIQTSRSISFADLVRYHQPPNLAVLLGYIERNLSAVGNKF